MPHPADLHRAAEAAHTDPDPRWQPVARLLRNAARHEPHMYVMPYEVCRIDKHMWPCATHTDAIAVATALLTGDAA